MKSSALELNDPQKINPYNFLYSSTNTFISRMAAAIIAFCAAKSADQYFPQMINNGNSLWVWAALSMSYVSRIFYTIIIDPQLRKYQVNRNDENIFFNFLACLTFITLYILPPYNKIGMVAPIIFTICFTMMGLCIACEFPRVMLSNISSTPQKHRGFIVAFIGVLSSFGFSCGTFLTNSLFIKKAFLIMAIIYFLATVLFIAISNKANLFQYDKKVTIADSDNQKTVSQFSFKKNYRDIVFLIIPLVVFNGYYTLITFKWLAEYFHRVHGSSIGHSIKSLMWKIPIMAIPIKLVVIGALNKKFGINRVLELSLILSLPVMLLSYKLPFMGAAAVSLSIAAGLQAIFSANFLPYIDNNTITAMSISDISVSWNTITSMLHGIVDAIPSFICYQLQFGITGIIYSIIILYAMIIGSLINHYRIRNGLKITNN